MIVHMAKTERKREERQKKQNGDTSVYVRIKDDLYTEFEKAWYDHITEHGLNQHSYGVGSWIRDAAKRELMRQRASKKS